MSLKTGLGCLGVLALVLGAGPARAEDPQLAKQLFQQGSVQFDLGQFDRAIEIWQRAYEEKQDPGLLYNIGQAYRLSGDTKKAVFFYKSFLRNAPADPKRREVEQKVVDLQKQIAEIDRAEIDKVKVDKNGDSARPVPQPEPTPSPAIPPAAVSTDPPLSARDLPSAMDPVPSGLGGAPQAPTEAALATRIDVGVAPGISFWLAGVAGDARPSFTLSATGGYTFDRDSRFRFRLGAAFAGTFLKETGSRETFLSVLVGPGLRIQAMDRLFLGADLGLGLLALTGLRPTSALLAQDHMYDVNGVQSFLEIRPTLSVAYWVSRSLTLAFTPAIAYSPKKAYFHAPLVRLELLASLGLRF